MARKTAATPRGDDDEQTVGYDDEQAMERAAAGDLAMLDDATFAGYKWSIWRRRLDEEIARDSQGGEWEFVAIKFGPIDEEWARLNLQGGTFDLRGYFDTGDGLGRRMRRRVVMTIAGPRKNLSAVTAQPAAPSASAAAAQVIGLTPETNTDRLIRMMIRERRESEARFTKLLEVLAQRPTAPPVQPVGIGEIVGAVKGIHELAGPCGTGTPEIDPIEYAKAMLDTLRQGYTMGQTADPATLTEPRATDWGPIIEKGLEVFGQMIQQQRARRPVPPGAPPPRPASHATVVPEPPAVEAEPAPQTTSPPEHRWRTAVEAVYRGMLNGRDPVDLAATLEDILDENEAGMLRGNPGAEPTADQVLAYLSPIMSEFPQLATEQGRVYLTSVLAALRETAPEEAEAVQ